MSPTPLKTNNIQKPKSRSQRARMRGQKYINYNQQHNREVSRREAEKKMRSLFDDEGEQFSSSDFDALQNEEPPVMPQFPSVMFTIALLKDMLDVLDFSLVGIIFTTLLSVLLGFILFSWSFNKTSGGWWKKRMIRKIWLRYIGVICIESLPFIKLVPVSTIFILMTHYDETKTVKLLNKALEMGHDMSVFK